MELGTIVPGPLTTWTGWQSSNMGFFRIPFSQAGLGEGVGIDSKVSFHGRAQLSLLGLQVPKILNKILVLNHVFGSFDGKSQKTNL